MQSKSELFESILKSRAYTVVTKAEIDGVEYLEGRGLVSAAVSGSLFAKNGPSVGGCVSRQADIIIHNYVNFSRRAKIRLFCRVELGDLASEWIPKGVFYIDTREADEASGTMTIHGYDAMLLHGGEVYLQEGDTGEWPRAADVVVAEIAERMGLQLDPRTVIDPEIMVSYPNDWTLRETLGYIAAAHCGNWTITDAGKLRLVPLWSIPDETHFLIDELGNPLSFGGTRILVDSGGMDNPNTTGFDKTYLGRNMEKYGAPEAFAPFSRVTVQYDEENAITVGDDTGRTLSAYCPFVTQEMAERMLSVLRGYEYQPFTAERAVLDPAAELGDGVTANGRYSVLAQCETTFNALMISDVAAPADEEIDHELPYESAIERTLHRKLTLGASYYGTSITRARGLEITRTNPDGSTGSRALLNSDVFALYDDDGREALYFDVNEGKFKFTGILNVANNFLVDKNGNVTIKGNLNLSDGSLFWGDNFPYISQFAASPDGPWHDEQEDGDIYRRDSWDGGETWGKPYQFVGKDGSDASVPNYIKRTYIDEVLIRSPTIEANEFNVYPSDEDDYEGSFNIYGMQLGEQYHMLAIAYQGYSGELTPYVDFYSPDGADLRFGYSNSNVSNIQFYGSVDFSNADVSGLDIGGGGGGSCEYAEHLEGDYPSISGNFGVEVVAGGDITFSAERDIVFSADDYGTYLAMRLSSVDKHIRFYVDGVVWAITADGLVKIN